MPFPKNCSLNIYSAMLPTTEIYNVTSKCFQMKSRLNEHEVKVCVKGVNIVYVLQKGQVMLRDIKFICHGDSNFVSENIIFFISVMFPRAGNDIVPSKFLQCLFSTLSDKSHFSERSFPELLSGTIYKKKKSN